MRRRMLSAGVGVLMLVGAFAGPARPAPTEAAWTDSEAAATSVTAATLAAPSITGCQTDAGVLGGWSWVTVTWTSGLSTSQQRVSFNGKQLDMQGTQVSGPVDGPYTYSLKYSQTLLGGLLGSLLGVNALITVTNTYPDSHWTSASTPWRFTTTLAGLFPTCTAA